MSKDKEKFMPHRSKLFSNFDADPKGVVLAHTDLLMHRVSVDKGAACKMNINTAPVTFLPYIKKRLCIIKDD